MKINIKVFNAVNDLANFLEIEPKEVANKLGFFLKKEDQKKLFDAYNKTIEFYQMPFEERARQMGFTVSSEGEQTVVSTTL